MSYDLLADDGQRIAWIASACAHRQTAAWKVLKHLNISRANFFGWSDGAVLGKLALSQIFVETDLGQP